MAVQAQYLSNSNVLLHNRSQQDDNNQLGNEYSLQPYLDGDGGTTTISRFLDHQCSNHILFNNFPVGSSNGNPRKRGREIYMNQLMSPLHQQQSHSKSNQIIELSQLHRRNAGISTGLRLAFPDQQHSFSPQSSIVLSLISDDLSTEINKQREEIDHFVQVQDEELLRTLAEKRQRHYHALIGAAEESFSRRMRDKEAEVEKAARRNAELEARAAQLSAEAHVWHARARAQEAAAAGLQAELQQAIVSGEGVEIGCAGGDTEDAESAYIDPDRVVVVSRPGCKSCGNRVASVLLLPCRHLCVCTECDDVVLTCPVCLSFRSSSIEVYMS